MSGAASRRRRRALFDALVILAVALGAYALALSLRGQRDTDAVLLAVRLTRPVEWTLAAACLGVWLVMALKGPANAPQRAIARFMWANFVLWSYLAAKFGSRGPIVTLAIIVLLLVVGLDLLARMGWRYVIEPTLTDWRRRRKS